MSLARLNEEPYEFFTVVGDASIADILKAIEIAEPIMAKVAKPSLYYGLYLNFYRNGPRQNWNALDTYMSQQQNWRHKMGASKVKTRVRRQVMLGRSIAFGANVKQVITVTCNASGWPSPLTRDPDYTKQDEGLP